MAVRTKAPREEPDWELVLKRNPVERLKQEKAPLGIRDELPSLIAAGYERVAEEDVVRLQWWGLYHDKPKIGTFMLRIKLPAGQVTPAKLRAIGEVSNRYGRGAGELTTRQNIQLHHLALADLPNVFADLDAAGITTAGGCGDTIRNITGCPLQGVTQHELYDCSGLVAEAAEFFYGNPDFANLPRKHKYSISTCTERCCAPELNCVSLVGAVHRGREGFGVLVGGGLSSVPRLARDLGVFVPKEEALEILGAITGVWSDDLRYRVSRVKARLKFMIDDIGPEGMRERLEERLGRQLEDFTLPEPEGQPTNHLGTQPQHEASMFSIGVPVQLGLISGDQLIALAELAERTGGDVRIARQQNFILTNVREADVPLVSASLAAIGFPVDTSVLRGNAIACTGEPHCNFAVTETKSRLAALLDMLEATFGDRIAELRLHLDGCPHSCAEHWVGDLGFQGTTVRDDDGVRKQAYDIFVRGALGNAAAIGRPLFRRVPTEELDRSVVGLVGGWLDRREQGESFTAFSRRLDDEQLGELAGLEPARARIREEAA